MSKKIKKNKTMFKVCYDVYNIIKVTIQTEMYFFFHNCINKLFSEEIKVPRTLFEGKDGGRVRYV